MKEMTLAAMLENIPEVIAFINEQLEALHCPMKVQKQIDMAVEELFVNIANYAYAPATGSVTVRFGMARESGAVEITFLDRGMPYNSLAKPDPNITLSIRDRQIGGLGIFMAKKSMDGMKYERLDEQNILTIIKKLE